jgi:hypothetical protein
MRRQLLTFVALLACLGTARPDAQSRAAAAERIGPLSGSLFPADNWWNQDISTAPVDARSAQFISFIGTTRRLHPDFGGFESPGSANIYGFPYVVVGADQPKRAVQFYYGDESDGVDHTTGRSFPFYPIPDEAVTQPYWIEGGPAGNASPGGDRHMLIVDRDNWILYELAKARWTGSRWEASCGAIFDLKTNYRRPEGWTSTDAAGLAIFPGLVRYDEAADTEPIHHAFRVAARATYGHVWPASHVAGETYGAPPLGARFRLKASKDISGYPPMVRRIFQAMKTYGLILADNGGDMYVTGTMDSRWDNSVLNSAFHSLHASDFEIIQLGWGKTTNTGVMH